MSSSPTTTLPTTSIVSSTAPMMSHISTNISVITSTQEAKNNSTAVTSVDKGEGFSQSTELGVGIIISVIVIIIIVSSVFLLLKRLGKLPQCCQTSRKRRSSTSSSRRVLTDEMPCDDVTSSHRPNEKLKQATEEMFTIDDFEDEEVEMEGGGVMRSDREEYYYDEVFGVSEFEDEATQNSVRQLYSNREEGEMLDLDFETLGISDDQFSSPLPPHTRV